jgi:NAD(P)-dependent dehydrogenase (short-subunit alcohol dehydrogenase family)
MNGKVILVTGATAGIGEKTAEALAQMGAIVVIHGRDEKKTRQVTQQIREKTGNQQVDYMVADFTSLADVRALAEEFRRRYSRLDVLVNNAGGYFHYRQETKDGHEMTFGVNHLAPFLLTNLLQDVILASAPARIINVSSGAHLGGRMNFEDLQSQRGYNGWQAYAQSKLANVLFTYELARRLEGRRIAVNALHPGFVATNFGKNNGGWMSTVIKLSQFFALTPEKGAETSIYLASSPEVEGVTGKYFVNRKAVTSSRASYDGESARQLWNVSLEQVGLAEQEKDSLKA